jgi:hypothetical protein
MALGSYWGGRKAVDGRPTLVGWFIVAVVCLSPILTFWIASVLGRFLRRRRWQRAQRRGSGVPEQPASTREDEPADYRIDRAH